MGFYIFLFIVCFSIAYISHILYKKNNINRIVLNIIDFLPYFILIIITGFRYNVGTDYQGYSRLFKLVSFTDYERIEITFKIFSKIALFFNFNQQFVFLIYATITYSFVYSAIRYYDKNGNKRHYIILLVLVFFLFNAFNTVRQMAAVSIFFYATKYIVERRLIKYLIFVCIAILFHYSACFCVLFYPLLNLRANKLLILLLISPIFYMTDIANKVIALINQLIDSSWYEIYLYSFNNKVEFGWKNTLLLFLIAIFFALRLEKLAFRESDKVIIKLFISYVIFYFMFLTSDIATRMLYYPMVSLIITIPLIGEITKNKKEKILLNYFSFSYTIGLLLIMLIGYKDLFYDDGILKYTFKIFIPK